MLAAAASSKPRPKESIQYVPGLGPRAVICPARPDSWPSRARMRQASAIFCCGVQSGTLKKRSMSALVFAWYSDLSRTIGSMVSSLVSSVLVHVGLPGRDRPARDLAMHVRGELLGRRGHDVGALLREQGYRVGILQR